MRNVHGLLRPKEIYFIQKYARGRKQILDIGSHSGLSTCILSRDTSVHIDAFEWFIGLPKPTEADAKEWVEGDYSSDRKIFLDNITNFASGQVDLHEGDATVLINDIKNFDFCFVDLDLYEPTLKIFEYCYKLLSNNPGAIIITHDYGAAGIIKACEYLKEKSDIRFIQHDALGVFIHTSKASVA